MTRRPGLSVRLQLTLSYAVLLVITGGLLLAVVYVFLLRYVPVQDRTSPGLPPAGPDRIDLLRAFVPPAVLALIALLIFGLVGGWFLAGRLLAPLARMTAVTRTVAMGSLSQRIELEGRNDEFRELADGFDQMLEQLEAHDAEQRRFAANASHELRTPLAITQTLLDVARDDPDRNVSVLIESLSGVNSRSIELVEALLLLSRAEQGSFVREAVDLSLLAEEAIETLLPIAEKRRVQLTAVGDPTFAVGSPLLLSQVITNLLHNAIVHSRPDGGMVLVKTRCVTGKAVLIVENDGSVVSPHTLTRITEPFQRGSNRVRTHDSGVGLGLAIVASITKAHGAELAIDSRPEGGLRVTLRFPVVSN